MSRSISTALAGVTLSLFTFGSANAASAADAPQWQAKDVQLVHVYDGHSQAKPGEGIVAKDDNGDLALSLTPDSPWAQTTFTETFPFEPRGVVHVNLAAIRDGDTTVQVACWDDTGKQLESFDIFRAIRDPGEYEMPFAAYRSVFPPETKRVSFRVSVGANTAVQARYHAIAYGTATNAVVPPPVRTIEKYEPAKEGTWNLPGEPPFVFAHYMAWFSTDEGRADGKPWDHWSREGPHGHNAQNRRADGLRDVASVYYPLIGTYDSSQPQLVHYHLATMKAAGISGVIVDWYGKGSHTDQCMPVLLDEAQRLGMRVGICFEEKLPCVWWNPKSRDEMLSNSVTYLSYLLNTYGNHPALLKRNGRPFLMQFNSYGTNKLGPAHLTPDEDRELLEKLPMKVHFCRQNLDAAYYPPIQAAYHWWIDGDRPRQFAQECAALRDKGRLEFFMSMLGVGFNDTGVWGWGDGPRVSKASGLPALRHTEEMATEYAPELIQCVTWNDYNEGTCFEPTIQNGFDYLDEVERFVGKIHNRPVNLDDNREAYRQYVATCGDRERQELPKVDDAVLRAKP